MAPSSRRQVLPPETLAAFGASPIYSSSGSDDGDNHSAPPSSSQFSKYFANTTSVETPIIGVKIGGWTISTQNSSIGDEQSMEKLTVLLEEIANSQDGANDDVHQLQPVVRQRRLCPPEITFLDAFISLLHENNSNHDGNDTANDAHENITTSSEIRFNATDALSEWAEAHKSLETQPTDEAEHDIHVSLSNQRKECRGVTILRTLDAKVWSTKSKQLTDDTASDSGGTAAHSSEFYYDWTFSSPYAGTILTTSNNNSSSKNSNIRHINNRQEWQPLPKSQIPFHLLQDTSQPILLYDDIHLFEDDLHDNGESSLNIKIRVMPKCWYVLQRLFVRVDYVCVKCREVRYFCLLDGNDGTSAEATIASSVGNNCKPNVVYRDVTWREASWAELNKMNLPMDPSAWMEHNLSASGGGIGGNISTGVPSFASLLTKLPAVSTPDDLKKHSYFEF